MAFFLTVPILTSVHQSSTGVKVNNIQLLCLLGFNFSFLRKACSNGCFGSHCSLPSFVILSAKLAKHAGSSNFFLTTINLSYCYLLSPERRPQSLSNFYRKPSKKAPWLKYSSREQCLVSSSVIYLIIGTRINNVFVDHTKKVNSSIADTQTIFLDISLLSTSKKSCGLYISIWNRL